MMIVPPLPFAQIRSTNGEPRMIFPVRRVFERWYYRFAGVERPGVAVRFVDPEAAHLHHSLPRLLWRIERACRVLADVAQQVLSWDGHHGPQVGATRRSLLHDFCPRATLGRRR